MATSNSKMAPERYNMSPRQTCSEPSRQATQRPQNRAQHKRKLDLHHESKGCPEMDQEMKCKKDPCSNLCLHWVALRPRVVAIVARMPSCRRLQFALLAFFYWIECNIDPRASQVICFSFWHHRRIPKEASSCIGIASPQHQVCLRHQPRLRCM